MGNACCNTNYQPNSGIFNKKRILGHCAERVQQEQLYAEEAVDNPIKHHLVRPKTNYLKFLPAVAIVAIGNQFRLNRRTGTRGQD